MLLMKIKNYVVSSADWSFVIDDCDYKSAARSGLIMAISKLGSNLKMSTIVMVNDVKSHEKNDFANAKFIPSHEIFKNLGLNKISKSFKELCSTLWN